ncbi:MAG: site-specific integrase [bacterium]|nr:site-specific integrase [bacterium]
MVRKGKGQRRKPFKDEWYDRQPDGTLKRRTKWFATKQEADDHEDQRRKSRPMGRPSIDPGSTVEVVAQRLKALTELRRGNTARFYASNLDAHILPHFRGWPMRDVDRGTVMDFLLTMRKAPVIRDGKTLRPRHADSTVRGILATFSKLAAVAVSSQIYPANPFARLGAELGLAAKPAARRNAVKKKAMTRPQLTRFRAAVEAMAPRLAPLFLLLARTGLRINEALALRVVDLDLDAGTLRVEREKVKDHKVPGKPDAWTIGPPKSDHGVRTVRLTPQLATILRRWLEVDRAKEKLRHGWPVTPPWLFYVERHPGTYGDDPCAGTFDDSNVRRVMRTVLRQLHEADVKAGLPVDARFPRHFTPHCFRHTFASLLLSEGQKPLQWVKEQLGHESIKLTSDTYGSWLPAVDATGNDCLDDDGAEAVSHGQGRT